MREFGQDDLQDAVTPPWSSVGVYPDSGATTEGWAMYVAAVSWYDPAQTMVGGNFVEPINHTATGIYNLETQSVPGGFTCAQSSGMPLQVARAFWDLDDIHNEGGDASNHSTAWLVNRWDEFPNGDDNREDFEDHENGVNMYDYAANAPLTDSDDTDVVFNSNCLLYQDI
jgi:hypothetical protein